MDHIYRREKHLDFTTLTKQIDSNIDPDFVTLLEKVESWNILRTCGLFENEEFIPVGSCVDGSKVTVPGDCGDMDVLIVSNKIILREHLFDYDKAFPAFLHIKVTDEHQKYFQFVKEPIQGVYLPTAVLKDLLEKMPFMSKVLLRYETMDLMSEDSEFLNVTRATSVGKEQMQLYPDEQNAFRTNNQPDTVKLAFLGLEGFAKYSLGGLLNLINQTEQRTQTKDESTLCETNNRQVLTDQDNTSLLEMLNKYLDMSEGKATDNSKTRHISHTTDESITEEADDEKDFSVQSKTYIEHVDSKMSRESFSTDTSLSIDCETNLSQGGPRTKTTFNSFSSDSELDNKHYNKNVMHSDQNESKGCCSAHECIKKSTEHGTEKHSACTSFSKLKSIDLVPAFKFEGWPRVADEWVTRSRKWPSKVTIKKVLESGCQVVAKRPLALYSKPIAEEGDPYFRLSFALSELILSKTMKEQQLLCWRVLKAFQKRFLETTPKCLTSYHWKNIMFWINEDLDESFWKDENVLVAVRKCLNCMTDCLQKRNLPFYFVKRMNLFIGCDETLFDILGEQIELIHKEPLEYLKRILVEPPCSEKHFIDKGMIKNMLSEEDQAKNVERKSKQMVNSAIPYLGKIHDQDKTALLKINEAITQCLKKSRSEVEEKSSCKDTQNSDYPQEKLLLDQIENAMESIKRNDEEAAFSGISDFFETSARLVNDEALNSENGIDSEMARNQRFANIFSSFSSVMKRPQGEDRSSISFSNILSSSHEFALLMQEYSESMHATSNGSEEKESKKATEIFSVLSSSYAKIIEATQENMKHEDKKEISLVNQMRKVLHESSEKIEKVFGMEDKAKKKPDVDIDLD